MCAVNSDIDDYQEDESDPEAGDEDQTLFQAPPGFFAFYICPTIFMSNSPETKDSESI
jgi:hypothetical protein